MAVNDVRIVRSPDAPSDSTSESTSRPRPRKVPIVIRKIDATRETRWVETLSRRPGH